MGTQQRKVCFKCLNDIGLNGLKNHFGLSFIVAKQALETTLTTVLSTQKLQDISSF